MTRSAPTRLAAAELAFREGHYYESETMAALAAEGFDAGSSGATRSMIAGARAAHAASGEERALALDRVGRASATSKELERLAALGKLAAAVELELLSCIELFTRLARQRISSRMKGDIRWPRAQFAARFGLRPSFDLARSVAQLLHLVDDPVACLSFRNVFAHTLAFSGEYDEALGIARVTRRR